MRFVVRPGPMFYVQFVAYVTFLAIKVGGHSLADWSWWWLLMPSVADLGIVVKAVGL